MGYSLPLKAIEETTYIVTATFTDEDGGALTPASLNFTLTDPAGTIINEREDVIIENPSSTEDVVLSGDDLAIGSDYPCWRTVHFKGLYNSSSGNDLPINSMVSFQIITLADVGKAVTSITDMTSLLGLYLEDSIKNEYPPAYRVNLLNQAQDRLMYLLPHHIFDELDTVVKSQDLDSNGSFNLSSLTVPVFSEKGIYGVKLTDGKFCNKISFNEYRSWIDAGKTFKSDDPVYYVRGSKICVEPYVTTSQIDIYYTREPDKLHLDSDSDLNADCELSENMRNIVVGLACEIYIDEHKSAARAYGSAMSQVEELKGISRTESIGHGILRNLAADSRKFNVLNC